MVQGIGKRVGGASYVHRSAAGLLPEEQVVAVGEAESRAGQVPWNVVRVAKDAVSFLLYEDFDTAAFPALLSSTKVDLKSGEVAETNYRDRRNPPVLHRKELLLAPDDPRLPRFRALTAAAEEHGLFCEAHRIGTRAAWEARLSEAGLVVKGHALLSAGEEHVEVCRHRTAIVRGDLSQPLQLMIRLGVVRADVTVFDYGCGQGEDVAALLSQGYSAFGWDPHHAAAGPRRPAEVVNLGFVLNVIEDQRERVETLKTAWGFAGRALCVSVMVQGKVSTAGQKAHRDGFLTSRGTFQKYYAQQELRELVSAATGQEPLSLAPGIVAVFKDKDLEQEVLFRRRSRSFMLGSLPRPPRRERAAPVRPGFRERIAPLLEELREVSVSLGRLPAPEEASLPVREGLEAARVSWSRIHETLREDLASDNSFAEAARARREDLLVHLALQQFPGSPKYRSLPQSLQIDLRTFFGGNSTAQAEGRQALFAAGDRAGVRADAVASAEAGLGGMRRGRRLRFISTILARLPWRLRVLVGCAEVLQGGVAACDFIDVDLESSRVSMITCDNADLPVPRIVERVRVDLGRLKVSVERREPTASPIYFKSRFLPRDDDRRPAQESFEKELMATGLFENEDDDPDLEAVVAALPEVFARWERP